MNMNAVIKTNYGRTFRFVGFWGDNLVFSPIDEVDVRKKQYA